MATGLLLFLCSVFQLSAFSLFNRLIEHTAWSPDISAALSNVSPSNTAPPKAAMAALLLLAAVRLLVGSVLAVRLLLFLWSLLQVAATFALPPFDSSNCTELFSRQS